jgi:hypothetical protein
MHDNVTVITTLILHRGWVAWHGRAVDREIHNYQPWKTPSVLDKGRTFMTWLPTSSSSYIKLYSSLLLVGDPSFGIERMAIDDVNH